jgi:hypothetical protein
MAFNNILSLELVVFMCILYLYMKIRKSSLLSLRPMQGLTVYLPPQDEDYEMLEKTNKDFGAHDGFDHFGWITKDVERLGGKIVTTQQMGYADFVDCFHLGGVNQNHLEGLKPEFVFHRPDIFSVYSKYSIAADVEQSPAFVERTKKILERLPVNPQDEEKWKEFFI